MNIFFVTRLFTSFEASLNNLNWSPEGLPTIYKLIESLDQKYNLNIFFLAKDSGKTYSSGWKRNNDIAMKVQGLKANISVFAGISYFNNFLPRKIAIILRDFRHLIKILIFVYREKPNIIYLDSSNVVIASILKLMFPKKKIILRVLGICTFLRSILDTKRIIHKIYKIAFRTNFSAVIGTQDGSGVEEWFDRILKKETKRYVLLNGVENINNNKVKKKYYDIRKKNKKKIIILFLGRLEENKGIELFLNTALKLLKTYSLRVSFMIAGSGSLYNDIRKKVKESSYSNNFEILGNIPHNEIMQLHKITDIYVSANKDGNLSNANLEAINSNDCMIIPKPRRDKKIDIKTYLFLKDSVYYYDINNSNDLVNKLKYLVINPNKIKKMQSKISARKQKFVKSWEDRIKEEEKILYNL